MREKKVVQVSEEFIFQVWSIIHLSGNVIKFNLNTCLTCTCTKIAKYKKKIKKLIKNLNPNKYFYIRNTLIFYISYKDKFNKE